MMGKTILLLLILTVQTSALELDRCIVLRGELAGARELPRMNLALPIHYYITPGHPAFARDSIERALKRWSDVDARLQFVESVVPDSVTINFVWWKHAGGIGQYAAGDALAVTEIDPYMRRVIVDAHTFHWPAARWSLDRVYMHELGHCLGLSHSAPDAVMEGSATEHLNASDKDQFAALYPRD